MRTRWRIEHVPDWPNRLAVELTVRHNLGGGHRRDREGSRERDRAAAATRTGGWAMSAPVLRLPCPALEIGPSDAATSPAHGIDLQGGRHPMKSYSNRRKTSFPGVYSRDDKYGERAYYIRWNDADGRAHCRSLRNVTAKQAARIRAEIIASARPAPARAVPDFYDPMDPDWIIEENSPDTCVYVGQRKINPVIVKIGYTTFARLRKRMQQERLHLLVAMPGGKELEGQLHERFADYVCDVDGAEFFFMTRTLRAWIEDERERRRAAMAGIALVWDHDEMAEAAGA
jgi:hypothetical protein